MGLKEQLRDLGSPGSSRWIWSPPAPPHRKKGDLKPPRAQEERGPQTPHGFVAGGSPEGRAGPQEGQNFL